MTMAVSVNETSDGRRLVHYDGQAFELTPSPGEVVCSGTVIHHRRDCGRLAEDGEAPRTHPDPERDLWQRLIESASSDDGEGRQEFAANAGLRNGRGGLIRDVCHICVLTPLTTVSGVRVPGKSLTTALAEFDREACAERVAEAEAQIAQVVREFPLESWPSMPLERYALGTDASKDSFSYRMEFGTPALSSIRGGHAGKHIIYWRRNDQSWYFGDKYSDEQDAWRHVRAGFVEAFGYAAEGRLTDIDAIAALRSGPMLTAKAISVYFPDAILPINSRDHVRAFILHLSGDTTATSLDAFAAHERLKQLIEADQRFSGWHPYEIGMFLYGWVDPRPISTTILKVAPGEKARYWDDCLAGGYICVGWDEVGDLTNFVSEEDYRAAFEDACGYEYKGNKSKTSAKANELWRLFQLRPGDLVVANSGVKEILAVGRVTEEGYKWRPERPEYRHTVSVDWDTSYAQTLTGPKTNWGTVTVAKVSPDLWRAIEAGRSEDVEGTKPQVIPVDPLFEQIADLLERKGQVIRYGPPGTGKTYTSLRFALWWLATRLPELELDPGAVYGTAAFKRALARLSEAGHLTQVTFHPAYGYEDFIEGFRPAEGPDGSLKLVLRDGVFTKICQAAAANPERPYLLLIDEINRGDIPKILGELITLLEPDKRGMHLTLPTGRRFAVPSNVNILGTMNTADRSIRLLDSALRRRFAFHELLPDADVLEGCKVGELDLGLLLRELNRRVVHELGRERQIGHSFFMPSGKPVDSVADLAAVIRNEVLPLLQEYAYDDYTKLTRFLGSTIVDVHEHSVAGLDDEALVKALGAELEASA
ncbi:AAA family ATPase [Actinomadura sp. NPDC047616]|uniref:AAA family ATPase n=1 Tax=Actinomadura sp. NPDC047616 TaxID=3155914 RepID=UPI0033CDFDEC